ncbi:MAG: hypothetical protein MPEBLZ_01793 [Candidatus Methanoperedens nitroreducens]|uniref:Uncharacterized protein n=1 Tax=Candidatus Methanoperedens nitratireducens TaxID=1392998 RepID=A0A0N8KR07_9EURY|nr:hypothetical protein [Candidatus Methanoperedens sp. BLZ2]KPQ43610.1 MAG: hypothetical protein MPEBLZ_01793 [Candidatus Methanoperedens sp. BLZ1]MCX9078470.1 hypothetical protein [Candidatus Methanoperedens sp.]
MMQKTHTKFSISLDTGVLKRIESKRGLIPRSAYIEKILEDAEAK